jgi:hypothetical protein
MEQRPKKLLDQASTWTQPNGSAMPSPFAFADLMDYNSGTQGVGLLRLPRRIIPGPQDGSSLQGRQLGWKTHHHDAGQHSWGSVWSI